MHLIQFQQTDINRALLDSFNFKLIYQLKQS